MTQLQMQETEIIAIENADFLTLKAEIRKLDTRVRENWAQGRKRTFVFAYYAGHGVIR